MKLFIFDLTGTLSTPAVRTGLPDVAAGAESGVQDSAVVRHGSRQQRQESYPGLIDAVDALWQKPCMLTPKLQEHGWSPSAVVVVDDEPILRRTALEPSALGDLVRLPSE